MNDEFEDFVDVDPGVEMDDDFVDVDPSREMDGAIDQSQQTKEREQFIIDQYKNQEEMMVLVFAQWCVNNDFDPVALYEEAYPTQGKNPVLLAAIEQTVEKSVADEIPHDLIYQVLQSFGNDDLVFVIDAKLKVKAAKEKK